MERKSGNWPPRRDPTSTTPVSLAIPYETRPFTSNVASFMPLCLLRRKSGVAQNSVEAFFELIAVAGTIGAGARLLASIPRRFIMYLIGIGFVSKKTARLISNSR